MRAILAAIAALLCGVAAPAAADWHEARTKHFLIYSQDSDARLRKFAERLESVHALMLMATGVREEAHPYPVRVYVVAGVKTVQSYMEKPDSNVAGFYRSLAAGPIAITPQNTGGDDSSFSPQVVLFHEYAHHFMLQFFPSAYPAWYVEGWAELVSTASFEKPGLISYGKVADHRRYELDLSSFHIKASRLVSVQQKDLSDEERARFYGSSWLLTHYLTFDPARHGQLAAYLTAFNAGASPSEAAKVFGDPRGLDRDLDKYLEAASFTYRQPPIPPEIARGVTIRPLAPDEAAMLPYALEFTKTMKPDAAKAFAARVEAAAAAFPDGAAAQQLAAQVDLDAGLLDPAEREAARAVALAPQNARAHYYLGAVRLERAKSAEGDKRTALIAAGKSEVLAANQLDANDPLPLLAFYESFGIAQQPPSDAGRAALARAVEIVPQDGGARMTYVYDLIMHGQKQTAARMLKPLAYDPHGGSGSARALKMLDILEGRATGDPLNVQVTEESDTPKPKSGS
ncbi:hypothetical protein QH494_10515 [Sphingomonas sp. AR_OL41]|uniref:hypothetical protein n=1 Tax=Sphingomonas sp. AR_OL41 TaxID=3042729 RepID=UPI0024813967|nr:hypothetical protein [Sphingomonas sp. AR_OL41]MDH7972615.1 hypothetical protein [Sphingomonas sp. AR_OL41]